MEWNACAGEDGSETAWTGTGADRNEICVMPHFAESHFAESQFAASQFPKTRSVYLFS